MKAADLRDLKLRMEAKRAAGGPDFIPPGVPREVRFIDIRNRAGSYATRLEVQGVPGGATVVIPGWAHIKRAMYEAVYGGLAGIGILARQLRGELIVEQMPRPLMGTGDAGRLVPERVCSPPCSVCDEAGSSDD